MEAMCWLISSQMRKKLIENLKILKKRIIVKTGIFWEEKMKVKI
jgi:hypothetical protein